VQCVNALDKLMLRQL